MDNGKEDIAKRRSHKKLSVALNKKQAELQAAKKLWGARLKKSRDDSHKEISKFKMERTNIVKEANAQRKANIVKAEARRKTLQSTIDADLEAVMFPAQEKAAASTEVVEREYLNTKLLEDAKFRQISDTEAEKYQSEFEHLAKDALDDYAVLESECGSELNKIINEIKELEAGRGPKLSRPSVPTVGEVLSSEAPGSP